MFQQLNRFKLFEMIFQPGTCKRHNTRHPLQQYTPNARSRRSRYERNNRNWSRGEERERTIHANTRIHDVMTFTGLRHR